jgi:hypothetical protein
MQIKPRSARITRKQLIKKTRMIAAAKAEFGDEKTEQIVTISKIVLEYIFERGNICHEKSIDHRNEYRPLYWYD